MFFVDIFLVGTFAVVCLMVGHVVEREVEEPVSPSAASSQSTNQLPSTSSGAGLLLNSIYKQESNNSFPSQQDLLDEKKLEVAVALSMLVGIFQVSRDNQAARNERLFVCLTIESL